MRKRTAIALVALMCGAASALADDASDESQKWCSKDGQVISQVEGEFLMGENFLDDNAVVVAKDYSTLTYNGIVYTPCK